MTPSSLGQSEVHTHTQALHYTSATLLPDTYTHTHAHTHTHTHAPPLTHAHARTPASARTKALHRRRRKRAHAGELITCESLVSNAPAASIISLIFSFAPFSVLSEVLLDARAHTQASTSAPAPNTCAPTPAYRAPQPHTRTNLRGRGRQAGEEFASELEGMLAAHGRPAGPAGPGPLYGTANSRCVHARRVPSPAG